MANDLTETLKERRKQHGDFNDHARITQGLKTALHAEKSWGTLADTQKEALEMIVHKIGRILAGDPDHEDHWRDIAGYATITADRLPDVDKVNWSGNRHRSASPEKVDV